MPKAALAAWILLLLLLLLLLYLLAAIIVAAPGYARAFGVERRSATTKHAQFDEDGVPADRRSDVCPWLRRLTAACNGHQPMSAWNSWSDLTRKSRLRRASMAPTVASAAERVVTSGTLRSMAALRIRTSSRRPIFPLGVLMIR